MNITQLLNKTTNTSKPNWENLNSSSITGVLSKLNLTNLNNQLIKANIYNESTAMEYLNLDPFLLYLSTVNISGCPLANDKTGNFCMYPRSTRWNCTAGNFCMAANHPSSCLPGFFCPENATQAVYCPPGYYCSADSKTIDICPDGYVCPLSTVNPISCGGLAYCPAGSFKVYRIGYAGVFFFVMIVAIFGSIASTRIKNLKNRRFNQSIRKVADPTICNNEKIENYSRLNVEFKDISLTLPNGQNILRGISGSFKSGKMCAIMGPSGSGKTSLLSILLGHVRPTTGEILVNGKHASLKEYSTELGFVPQDDVMYRNLSIREILQHSANTRLPHHMDYFQRNQKVIDVLKMLGIESISHKVVGDAEKRGISGGQRKRVNIAIELVTNPMILFLDEPTTGLDSSTSTSLCQNLSEIAQTSNLCIASIIHSPSVAAFRQFDDLLLLGKGGKLIYHGSRIDALQYFHFIGFTCPKRESPADFYINVISGKVPSEYNPAFISTDLSEYWKLYCSGELNFEIGKRMTPQEAIDAQIAYLKNPVLLERQNTQLITARRVFLGIGTNEAEFYGKLPSDLCVLAPFVLQDLCSSSTDTLKLIKSN
ncbi:hypothetical protein HDV02_004043 [Globomyces sp. JEL0801]|nr:hypothetical protein HDV02_004043 [Globomyces sp. JEL0801]